MAVDKLFRFLLLLSSAYGGICLAYSLSLHHLNTLIVLQNTDNLLDTVTIQSILILLVGFVWIMRGNNGTGNQKNHHN